MELGCATALLRGPLETVPEEEDVEDELEDRMEQERLEKQGRVGAKPSARELVERLLMAMEDDKDALEQAHPSGCGGRGDCWSLEGEVDDDEEEDDEDEDLRVNREMFLKALELLEQPQRGKDGDESRWMDDDVDDDDVDLIDREEEEQLRRERRPHWWMEDDVDSLDVAPSETLADEGNHVLDQVEEALDRQFDEAMDRYLREQVEEEAAAGAWSCGDEGDDDNDYYYDDEEDEALVMDYGGREWGQAAAEGHEDRRRTTAPAEPPEQLRLCPLLYPPLGSIYQPLCPINLTLLTSLRPPSPDKTAQ